MDPMLLKIIEQHGAFLRREASVLGYHDKAIARLARVGEWHRIRHGAYTYGALWNAMSREQQYGTLTRAVMRTAATEAVLSHTSALPHLGAPMWGVDLSTVHLTRLDQRAGRHGAGVRQHQGLLLPGDVVEDGPVLHTSATRAALEVSTLVSTEASLVITNYLLHRGLTTPEDLRRRYEAMNRWPHTLHTDLVLRLGDPRIESVGESRLFYLFWRQHLPAPTPQYVIVDENGEEIARLDFALLGYETFVEFDGQSKYDELLRPGETARDAVLREKRREEMIMDLTGWRCVRVTWRDLSHPEATAARIRRTMTMSRRAS